jgi:hypothetical protein
MAGRRSNRQINKGPFVFFTLKKAKRSGATELGKKIKEAPTNDAVSRV